MQEAGPGIAGDQGVTGFGELYTPPSAAGADFAIGGKVESREETVTRLYQEVLGREPDAEGLKTWVGRLEAGMSPAEARERFANSAEFGHKAAANWAQIVAKDFGNVALQPSAAQLEAIRERAAAGQSLHQAVRAELEPAINAGDQQRQTRFRIAKAYQEILGREPGAEGLQVWGQRIQDGLSADEMRSRVARSNEATGKIMEAWAGTVAAHFGGTGATPTAEQLESIRQQMEGGATLGQAVTATYVAGLRQEDAAASNRAQLQQVYRDLLGRDADDVGLKTYGDQLAAGRPLAEIRMDIARSEEATGRLSQIWTETVGKSFGGTDVMPSPAQIEAVRARVAGGERLDAAVAAVQAASAVENVQARANEAAITDLYREVLNREPDDEGLATWKQRVADGRSLADVREAFANSPEMTARLTQYWAGATFAHFGGVSTTPSEEQLAAIREQIMRGMRTEDAFNAVFQQSLPR